MPDPVRQLIEEHNQLRRLFKSTQVVGGHQSAETRAHAICELLTIHARLEEDVVYPAIRDLDEAMAQEAEAAHQRADALVEKIKEQEYADNGGVKQDLDKLEREVETHVRWEEDVLLPRISSLPTDEFDRIGTALYQRHQELLSEAGDALNISAESEGFIATPRI